MTIDALLTQYGQRQAVVHHTLYVTAYDPQQITTCEKIAYRDQSAARDIALLESYVEALRAYRQELARRYGELETMSYCPKIYAQRYAGYDKKITYCIRLCWVYEDGTEGEQLSERYPGKERAKALSRIRELEKQYPTAARDYRLEKSKWER